MEYASNKRINVSTTDLLFNKHIGDLQRHSLKFTSSESLKITFAFRILIKFIGGPTHC